jgi:hypothetical protein
MWHWRSIEEDIANCSNKILNQGNLTTLTVNTHDLGRTVLVSGIVEREADKQKALNLLKDQCHMTGLEHDISVIIPKPSIKPSLSLQFKDNQIDLSGKVSTENEVNNILSNFTHHRLNQNINTSKDVIPSNFSGYLSNILPYTKQVSNLNISLTPNVVKLKGTVESQALKFAIGKNISESLSYQARLINMLQVVGPEGIDSAGVQPGKISSLGVGSTQPITTNQTAQDRSKNRRIEFKVHSL